VQQSILFVAYLAVPVVLLGLGPILVAKWRGYVNVREIHHGLLGFFYATGLGILVQGQDHIRND